MFNGIVKTTGTNGTNGGKGIRGVCVVNGGVEKAPCEVDGELGECGAEMWG